MTARPTRQLTCSCGQRLRYRADEEGLECRCPTCGSRMVLPETAGLLDPKSEEHEENGGQGATRICAVCRESIAARFTKCPICHAWSGEDPTADPDRRGWRRFHERPWLPVWDDPYREVGISDQFVSTVALILQPVEVFSGMRAQGYASRHVGFSLRNSLLAGILASILYTLPFASAGMGYGFACLFFPITIFGGLFRPLVTASAIHLTLRIVGKAHAGFESTFRISCYATGTSILMSAIPFVGILIDVIWSIPLHAIGLREAQGLSSRVAFVAAAAPVVLGALLLGCC